MATIKEDYVSYDVAKLLKEKGFNEFIRCWYDNFQDFHEEGTRMSNTDCLPPTIMCPTLQMAMSWLRKTHHLHIGINPVSGKGYNATIYDVADFDDYGIISDTEFFFHAEEACEAAIKYCLENLI